MQVFMLKYNICIEWDEKHHNGTKQKEKEFLKNIEVGIRNVTNLILNHMKN